MFCKSHPEILTVSTVRCSGMNLTQLCSQDMSGNPELSGKEEFILEVVIMFFPCGTSDMN